MFEQRPPIMERSQNLFSTGNETFDKFLGGGLLNTSLNLFERQGPSSRILDSVWNKSLASSTLVSKNNVIQVNFNTLNDINPDQLLSSLPIMRKVTSKLLYKDVQGKSASTQIKIAWRYSSRNSSPSDSIMRTQQVDFGVCLSREVSNPDDLGLIRTININENFSLSKFFNQLETEVHDLKKQNKAVNIIITDILNPFSPIIDEPEQLCKFMYALRCFARDRLLKGVILISYDTDQLLNHSKMKQQLYNIADCVLSFYSYETGQNKITGYKNIDGTLEYLKVPKINSFGYHFQRELSDYGYRFTRNHRFFVVDELSLPPLHDDEDEEQVKKKNACEVVHVDFRQKPLEQVGPLEDFREVAGRVLSKQL